MVLWITMIVLNFLIALMGLTANVAFFRLVVFSQAFDGYCRISAFIISSGMTLTLASNVVSVTICLFYGSFFEGGPCARTESHILMLYLHAYGEFSVADGLFILVFERYASVFFPSLRSTNLYKLWFLALLSVHIITMIAYIYLIANVRSSFAYLFAVSLITGLFVTSFALTIYLFCAAKNKYYETLGLISLTKRYMLSESYELCKSALPATFVTSSICLLLCVTSMPMLLGFYEFGPVNFAMINVVLNINATAFPILFLYGSRKIRTKILKIAPFHSKRAEKPEGGGIRKLNGHRISISQSQNEYFDKLKTTWS